MGANQKRSERNLTEISVQEWPVLRELYRRQWPRHILSYYTLQNYIDWAAKNSKMDDVHISSTDDEWREHGTYILEDRNKFRYNVLFNTLEPQEHDHVFAALQRLERHAAYTLTGYVEQVRPAAEQHLRALRVTDFSVGFCPTSLYILPQEKSIHLALRPTPGFVIRPLKEEWVNFIDDLWPHKYPGSDYKIRRVIRYNMTFGAFDQATGVLCAWVMQMQLGTIGILQVDEKYRRRGLAEWLVRLMSIRMAEKGMDATANIMASNVPSRSLFEKMGFTEIDKAYWFDKLATDDERQTD